MTELTVKMLESGFNASGVYRLTPATARWILARNDPRNKRFNPHRVAMYRCDMEAGHWALTHQGIALSTQRLLIDGRHRMLAAVEAGATIDTWVFFDCDPDACFYNTDCMQPRTSGQELASRNIKNANAVSAVHRMIWRYESGRAAILNAALIPTRFQLRDVEQRHPEVGDAVCLASGCKRLHAGTGLTVVYHYARLGQPVEADRFIEALATGAGLEDGSPVLALRNRLIDNASSKGKLPSNDLWSLSIKAWNMFLSGREVRFLKWAKASGEQFPEIAGWPIGVKR